MITKEQVEQVIKILIDKSTEAEKNRVKWEGKDVTYGDWPYTAEDVEFGRGEGLDEAIEELRKLINQ